MAQSPIPNDFDLLSSNMFLMKFLNFILFTDALLADLQNSVPGNQQNFNSHIHNGSSGYGSLRPKLPAETVSNIERHFPSKS